jgi:integrase
VSVIIKGKNPRRPHTVRYWADGRQREKSFALATDAKDFKIKVDHDTRARIFIDDKLGREDFGQAVDDWIGRHAVGNATKNGYRSTARTWLGKTFQGRSVAQVANDRDRVTDLLNRDMADLSITKRKQARAIITGTVGEAVKAGKIPGHHLHDIELYDNGRAAERSDFVFPAHGQVRLVADGSEDVPGGGICVWLMRGCGLRIEEALGVHREDFLSPGKLRLTGQASRDGRDKLPLKHRKRGEYRDIPVPGWLWELVSDLPEGPLMPGNSGRAYQLYNTVLVRFQKAAKQAGIPTGFRPHSLRHAFASALLSRGVPITDVARWLGHKDIRETFNTYSHFMPDAEDRALTVLNAEYAEWAGQDG